MPRWQPDPAQRLAIAALDLFFEQGYERTTVAQIAARAGLAKSSFFRHFPDKREVLFSGGDTLAGLLREAVAAAPSSASPLEALALGLDAAGTEVFTAELREFSSRRRTVVIAHPELQERDALKNAVLQAAMTSALTARGVPELTARLAAEMGLLAMTIAHEQWSDPASTEPFAAAARQALDDVRAVGAALH